MPKRALIPESLHHPRYTGFTTMRKDEFLLLRRQVLHTESEILAAVRAKAERGVLEVIPEAHVLNALTVVFRQISKA